MKFFKKTEEFIVNFLNLTKFLSNVKNIAIILLAFYLSGSTLNWNKLITGVISLSFISSAIYIYNNISDERIDRYNARKIHYSNAVGYFGKANAIYFFVIFAFIGFYFASTINLWFLVALTALFITGLLYSFELTRFKERIILDVLFGASLTFFFRFIASWFVFSTSFPPLLAIVSLVSAKTAGYILYKETDKAYLSTLKIKNSITIISKKSVIIASIFLWVISFASFIAICLNSQYFHMEYLGKLPKKFLFLMPLAIPPLGVIYFLVLNKIKTQIKHLRIIGFTYWILVIIIIWTIFVWL